MKKGKVEKIHMEYTHDGLKYESFPRLGAKACAGGKTHYYLQIPLSNNGYMYRIIDDADIGFRNLSLHRGATHPAGIGGFVSLTEVGAARFRQLVRIPCLEQQTAAARGAVRLRTGYNMNENHYFFVPVRNKC